MRARATISRLVFLACTVSAMALAASSIDYDTPPKLIGTGTVGPAHCEIVQFDPKDAAIQAQNMIVAAIVGRQGLAMNVHVVRGVGMGMDEKAVVAVRQLRFTPATKDGAVVPTPVPIYLRVTFDNMPAQTQ